MTISGPPSLHSSDDDYDTELPRETSLHCVVFGDSTVSVDRSWILTGGVEPSLEKYGAADGHHRFTNGQVYVEHLFRSLQALHPATAMRLDHYAYGGATTDDTMIQSKAGQLLDVPSKGVRAQMDEYMAATAKRRRAAQQMSTGAAPCGGAPNDGSMQDQNQTPPVVAFVNVGGNDWCLTEFDEGLANLSDATPIVDRLLSALQQPGLDLDVVFIATLPDYDAGPLHHAFDAERLARLRHFIGSFNARLVEATADLPHFHVMDVHRAVQKITTEPAAFAMAKETIDVPFYPRDEARQEQQQQEQPGNKEDEHEAVRTFLWYDSFHMTTRSHEIIAEDVRHAILPVVKDLLLQQQTMPQTKTKETCLTHVSRL